MNKKTIATDAINVTKLIAELNTLLQNCQYITAETARDIRQTSLEAKIRFLEDDERTNSDEIILRAKFEVFPTGEIGVLILGKPMNSASWNCYVTSEAPPALVTHRLSDAMKASTASFDYRTSTPRARQNEAKSFGISGYEPLELVKEFIDSFGPAAYAPEHSPAGSMFETTSDESAAA